MSDSTEAIEYGEWGIIRLRDFVVVYHKKEDEQHQNDEGQMSGKIAIMPEYGCCVCQEKPPPGILWLYRLYETGISEIDL